MAKIELTLEQMAEAIRQLPPEERERLRALAGDDAASEERKRRALELLRPMRGSLAIDDIEMGREIAEGDEIPWGR